MIEQTDLVLEQAESYVRNALLHLSPTLLEASEPELSRGREEWAAQLRIHFLFPQLSPEQRQWLLTLYWHRQVLMRLFRFSQRPPPLPLRNAVEAATRQSEQCFMALANQARHLASTAAMSSVQLALLDREFLHIGFPDPAQEHPASSDFTAPGPSPR